MKRLRRRLFNLATVLSLVLCVAMVAMWMRSYIGEGGSWAWHSHSERYHFEVTKGQVNVGFRPDPAVELAIRYWETTLAVTVIQGTTVGRFFFQILFPLWMPAVIFLLFPLIRTVWWYRMQPVVAGVCLSCGYDLRATPDRCPECGAVPESTKRAAN